VRVWDLWVRIFHWSLVAGIAFQWVSSEDLPDLHQATGLGIAALVALRLLWGLVGSRHARFSQFVTGPGTAWRFAVAVLHGREARHLGHNPLGAWMIVALLFTVAGTALTGWLCTTDALWGEAWIEELHEGLATGMLGLVGLHVAGVVFTSLHHGENLVRAMFTGRKAAPRGDDVA